MDREAATQSERSDIVASGAKDRVTGLPWCVSVTCSSFEATIGAEGESVSAILGLQVSRVENWRMLLGSRALYRFGIVQCKQWG